MRIVKPYLLALLAGLLLLAASPGHWALPLIAWIGLLPLIMACQGLTPRSGFRLGLLCGAVYYTGLIHWITIALGRYGGLPPWLTVPALLGLALYMALYLGLFAAGLCWFGAWLPMVWFAPALWVGLDWIRGHLFTGFPWLDLGYTQTGWPLLNQIADLTGHYGITFLIVLVNAMLAETWRAWPHPPRRRLFVAGLILLSAMSYNLVRYRQVKAELAGRPAIKVGLIQGNIDQSEKWQPPLQERTVTTYLDLSRRAEAQGRLDLLVWPETALPFFPDDSPLFTRVTGEIGQERANGPALLTGAPHFTVDLVRGHTRYFNSALLISPLPTGGVSRQRYDKEHLVPFGEYIPLHRYLSATMPLVQSMGNFSPGGNPGPLIHRGMRLGVLICFESIFPDEARVRVSRGANLLVNLTNDAWYGRSSAPFQQVPMAVLRAIENRRSLARAANTGISCLIDPLGRVQVQTPIFTTLEVTGQVPLMEGYSLFTRLGFIFPGLCLLFLSGLIFYGIFRSNRV